LSEPLLSVVLPCRNQADHIARVLDSYAAPLQSLDSGYELVVVPNACDDATPEIVDGLARVDPHIRAVPIRLAGWGRAVRTGLDAARGQWLCFTNSARTDPRHLAPLLALARARGEVVAKVRRRRRRAPVRELGSWLYNLEARLLFGIGVHDVNGTPKILPRSLHGRLALESVGDLLDLELLAKAHRLKVGVLEMPVEGFPRHGGRSSTGLGSAWRMYAGAFTLRRGLRAWGR
jgi:glycosyltransferase involved in cell wall biosynthesis